VIVETSAGSDDEGPRTVERELPKRTPRVSLYDDAGNPVPLSHEDVESLLRRAATAIKTLHESYAALHDDHDELAFRVTGLENRFAEFVTNVSAKLDQMAAKIAALPTAQVGVQVREKG